MQSPTGKGAIISRREHVTVYPPNLLVSLTGALTLLWFFCSLSARVSESGETIIKCQPKHFLRQHTDYNPGETSGMKNSSFMIFREDDIQSYTNRYDMILLKSSSKPSSSTNTTSPGSANWRILEVIFSLGRAFKHLEFFIWIKFNLQKV